MPKIKFTIITLFQEALKPYLDVSMMWKAQDKGIAEFDFVNLRDFGLGPHKSVDDTPYGGGDGMLLRCEPVFNAIESVKAKDPSAKVILPTPAGALWNQEMAKSFAIGDPDRRFALARRPTGPSASQGAVCYGARSLSRSPLVADAIETTNSETSRHFIILCPHYEGYDERILSIVDYPICLGPYVLTGGELPALIIIDSIVRLIPGVLGGETSAEIESFSDGNNIEYPQYTKPYDFRGMKVPDILLSGNHGEVDKWRAKNAKTLQK